MRRLADTILTFLKIMFFEYICTNENISWKERQTHFTIHKIGLLEDFLFQIHLLNTQQYNKSNGKSSCWYSKADVSDDGKS